MFVKSVSMFMGNGKRSCRSSAPIPLPWELPQSSPPEGKHLIFWSSFPVSFLGGWKVIWEHWYSLNLGFSNSV